MEFRGTLQLEVQRLNPFRFLDHSSILMSPSASGISVSSASRSAPTRAVLSYGAPSTPTHFVLGWVRVCGSAKREGRRNFQDVQIICSLKYFSSLCNLECSTQECGTIFGIDDFNCQQARTAVIKPATDLGRVHLSMCTATSGCPATV